MMSEEKRIFEYFVVAGVPDENPEELTSGAQECGYKDTTPQPPITDICVIFPSIGEQVPEGFTCIEYTPTGLPADLNHGSIRAQLCYLCFRRGYHKPPLVDLGIMYEGRGEKPNLDSQMLKTTPYGRPANVNNSTQGIYFTYRRASDTAGSNLFAVTDICIILTNKGEAPPHTFYKINKNLNKGMLGSDVFMCYKKSLATSSRIAYKPAMLDRFPAYDHPEYPLPPSVPLFGLPMGAVLECWPAKCQIPARQFSTFVLTDQKGRKLYGAAVSFYEHYSKPLSAEQMEKLGLNPANDYQQKSGSCSDSTSTNDPAEQMAFHTMKAICLVSRYPFFNAFKRFLTWLHRMVVIGSYSLPIERYISHLMYEVPFPTQRRPRIMVQMGNERILFDNPEDSPLPVNGASYVDPLRLLGVENYMYLMMLTLLEQKILVHSLRSWYLTSVAEALTTLIFPFHWQCPYIPQCPLDLAGVLHAPLPFVVGVDSRFFELYEDPPRDVTSIDLDTNTISQSEVRQRLKLALLPRRAAKVLRQALTELDVKVQQEEFHVREIRSAFTQQFLPVEVDLRILHRRRQLELQIQEAFLRFMISLMKGYQHYLKPLKSQPQEGATDLEALFDINGFLRSRDKSSHEFYRMLLNTQLFIRFIEERSFLSDKDRNAYLAFFDECAEKLDMVNESKISSIDYHLNNNGELHLLEVDDGNSSEVENAVLFAPPETSGWVATPGGDQRKIFTYANNGFPKLKPEYFALDKLILEDNCRYVAQGACGSVLDTNLAAQRTRQEAKTAIRLAKQQAQQPIDWAKCLLSYAYSLWFMHLPSYLSVYNASKTSTSGGAVPANKRINARLAIAYEILQRMLTAKLPIVDEVCFRILIQVCGRYGHPILAVQVFLAMKKLGIHPNAITYGFYNRAVLEARWPSSTTLNARKFWTKLRIFIWAVARFKAAGKRQRVRNNQFEKKSRRTLSDFSTTSTDYAPVSSIEESVRSKTTLYDDLASLTTAMSVEVQAKSDSDEKSRATFDLGYHSQLADEEESESATLLGADGTAKIRRSKSIPVKMAQKGVSLSLACSNRLDRLREKSHIVSRRRKTSLGVGRDRTCSILDSSAGLLMLADSSYIGKDHLNRSILNDSVFERSSQETTPVLRNGNGKPEEPKADTKIEEQAEVSPKTDIVPLELVTITDGCETPRTTRRLMRRQATHDDPLALHSPPQPDVPAALPVTSSPMLGGAERRRALLEQRPFQEDELDAAMVALTPATPSGMLGKLAQQSRDNVRGLLAKWTTPQALTAPSPGQNFGSATLPMSQSSQTLAKNTAAAAEDLSRRNSERTPVQPSRRTLSTVAMSQMPETQAVPNSADINLTRMFKNQVASFLDKSLKTSFVTQITNSPLRDSISSLVADYASGSAAVYLGATGFGTPAAPTEASTSSTDGEFGSDAGMDANDGFYQEPAFELSAPDSWENFDFNNATLVMDGTKERARPESGEIGDPVIDVALCSSNQCPECRGFCFDEEIMSGWVADESELTSRCPFCSGKFPPQLTVIIRKTQMGDWLKESFYVKTAASKNVNKKEQKSSVNHGKLSVGDCNVAPKKSEAKTIGLLAAQSACSFEIGSVSSLPEATDRAASMNNLASPLALAEEAKHTEAAGIGGSNGSLFHKLTTSRRILFPSADEIPSSGDSVDDERNNDNAHVETSCKGDKILTIPLLSPIVLRKELETVVSGEGDECLVHRRFLARHTILFWNLLFYFQRLAVPTHLTHWLPKHFRDSELFGKDVKALPPIFVRCVYHSPHLHKRDAAKPLLTPLVNSFNCDQNATPSRADATDGGTGGLVGALLGGGEHRPVSRAVAQQIVDHLEAPNVHKPLTLLINEHRKRTAPVRNAAPSSLPRHFSIYRDLQFLALSHFGRDLRQEVLEREYDAAFEKLPPKIAAMLPVRDRAPQHAIRFCRRIFRPLDAY